MNVRHELAESIERFARADIMFGRIKKMYFVGIGGAGMSGIAEILHSLGFQIRGSDLSLGEVTDHLQAEGITVFGEHSAGNLGDTEVVVISSAVGEDNPEVIEARRRSIPVIKRAEMLGEIMRLKYSIGVAGTHGKTTTTSMIGSILRQGGLHPTIIVGGIVTDLGTGAALGSGDYLVAEADEYDRSFLAMYPTLAVVTNVEADHLDCYHGIDDLVEAFTTYINRVPFYGSVVINNENECLSKIRPSIARPFSTFGFEDSADVQAVDVRLEEGRSHFAIRLRGEEMGRLTVSAVGRHNVSNALAAVAACFDLGVEFDAIADGLLTFSGVSRRFEIIGEANGILVVDDYAHHPTEIRATLETATSLYNRRVIAVFQPHLYSRTRDFVDQFAEALSIADQVLLVDIYPAREKPIEGVTSELIERRATQMGFKGLKYIGPKEAAVEEISKIVRSGDMVITMGAGSITVIRSKILEAVGRN